LNSTLHPANLKSFLPQGGQKKGNLPDRFGLESLVWADLDRLAAGAFSLFAD